MPYTTINKGSSYFNTVLYTGTGASNSVTGVGFKPDWVWIKRRDTTASHGLFDINRGVNKQLRTNNSNAEETVSWFPSFNTDGFTVSTTESDGNASGGTYVAWNWLGSNTTTSNTSGTISSTVSVNQTAGFSIVTWIDSASTYTVGHGLGVAPKFIILKDRGTTYNWDVGCDAIGWANRLILNSTAASGAGYWNSTAPTSSVFTYIGNGTANMVAYCFAEVKGYSKFGSYTGNGSADGTFIYTGFKPAFLIIKESSAAGAQWYMYDNKTATFNLVNANLFPNLTNATNSGNNQVDFYSNGFKMRSSNTDTNNSGNTYIYMAFAENPFVTSGGIPVTAR